MRLVDADGFIGKFDMSPLVQEALRKALNHMPTVDAVEVVRCEDCYYCATEKSFGKEYLYCDAFYEHAEGDLIGVSLMVERREDG